MGRNTTTAIKEDYNAESTFTGANLIPSQVGIVGLPADHPHFIPGLDVPLADWNEDLWDDARMKETLKDPIDPRALITTLNNKGRIPPIDVTRRRDLVLVVEGRRRVIAGRAANKLIQEAGTRGHDLITLPATIAKGADLDVAVRVGNAGRHEDRPWVRARNAARLKARKGDTPETAQLVLATEQINETTLKNWGHYMDLVPAIQALVEDDPAPGALAPFDRRIPFNVGYEIGKIGPGETARQILALTVLRNTKAQLTGEQGRANARQVVKAILAGQITEAPPMTEGDGDQDADGDEDGDGGDGGDGGGSGTKGKSKGPKLVTNTGRMTAGQLRGVFKALEGLTDKSEAENLAFAVLAVINGVDPQADFLARQPRIQALFRAAMGIKPPSDPKGPPNVPGNRPKGDSKAPKDSQKGDPNKAPSANDLARRSIKCPNPTCNKGHDQKTKNGCNVCGGYGEISPMKAAELAGRTSQKGAK